MLSLITTPSGQRLIRSNTKRQAVDHVVKGTITAKTINADELADLLDAGLVIENADYSEQTADEAPNKSDTTNDPDVVADNQGSENDPQ